MVLALLPLGEGHSIASPASLSVSARIGTIVAQPRREPDGLWRFVYVPPEHDRPVTETFVVRVEERRSTGQRGTNGSVGGGGGSLGGSGGEAGTLRLELRLEPPPKRELALSASPTPLVIGRTRAAEIRCRVKDPSGAPASAALRLAASAGALGPVREVAPGEYVAEYRLPREAFPQVAVILALSVTDGAFAVLALPLHAAVTVDGEAEPGGEMRVLIDGRAFGPVTVDAAGRFSIPVLVPPGGRAVGVLTDRAGNRKERPIDLRLPPFRRLVVAAVPSEIPVGEWGRSEVIVAAVDSRGRPARSLTPALSADAGAVGKARQRGAGVFAAEYRPPPGIGSGVARITATLAEGSAATQVTLRPGPPRRVAVIPPPDGLLADGTTAQPVRVSVQDAAGSPVGGARVSLSLPGGRVVRVTELGRGEYEALVVPPPDPGDGRVMVTAEASGGQAGAPRSLTLRPRRPGTSSEAKLAVEAWVDDDFGLPVPAASVVIRAAGRAFRGVTDAWGAFRCDVPLEGDRLRLEAHLADIPAVGATLDAVRTASGWRFFAHPGAPDPHEPATARADVTLRPAVPVDLRARVEPPGPVTVGTRVRVLVRATDGRDKPLSRLRLLLHADGGAVENPVEGPTGTYTFGFTPAVPGRRMITVTESRTGVSVAVPVTASPFASKQDGRSGEAQR